MSIKINEGKVTENSQLHIYRSMEKCKLIFTLAIYYNPERNDIILNFNAMESMCLRRWQSLK